MNSTLYLLVLLVTHLFICGPANSVSLRQATTPAGVPWKGVLRDSAWMTRHKGFVKNTNINGDNINVLFYGDSIMDAWDEVGNATFEEFYVPLGVANYGIFDDSTEHVLWRIDNGEVVGLDPKICVLKIGTNNLESEATDQDIARGIAAITDTLRSKLPNMKILLLGILPRTNETLTDRAENVNSMISILDNGNTVRFLNMRDTFYKGNGTLYTELYNSDLLHLSAAGYAAWAGAMNPLFNEMYQL